MVTSEELLQARRSGTLASRCQSSRNEPITLMNQFHSQVDVLSLGLLNGGDKSLHPAGSVPRQQLFTFDYENVLGTSLEVKVLTASAEQADKAEAAARREIDRQAKILSAWDPDSEFSRGLQTHGQPVRVSPDLFEVLGLFDRWRERTGGALDASAEVITRVWRAAEAQNREP